MLDSPEKYKKGVAFYAARSTFFLPEEEMTEEELLELIDFREKRDYSLAKITEEIEAGDYEYVKTEDSALPGDMSQESGSQQTQDAGEASVVPGADTAAQEWQVAYEGDVSIRCAAVAENGLYVGGFTADGQARVEYLPYGSGTPETFFEDFAENGEVYSLCTAPDGSIYAAAQAVGDATAGNIAMTLVSVDPESLRFVPVAGGENVICSADTIYLWKMVAAGVSETADFILWGYNGVDSYRLGETEFTRVQENWEMPCGTEGTCAVLVPDGRILYIGASDGFQGTTADGVEISGKDPEKTVLYYEPLVK